jgi:hypothetical protein
MPQGSPLVLLLITIVPQESLALQSVADPSSLLQTFDWIKDLEGGESLTCLEVRHVLDAWNSKVKSLCLHYPFMTPSLLDRPSKVGMTTL